MSLHPAKKSDVGKSWMRPGRETTFQMQLGHHLIVTEGAKTEPSYFNSLKKTIERNNRKDKLRIEGQGMHTVELMERAKQLVRRSGITYKHVWLVYDKDDFLAEEFNQVEKLCKDVTDDETEYHAIWSNQCVELWYLLHFGFYQTDIHRNEYFPKLSGQLQKIGAGVYTKNRGDMFEVLLPYLDTAIANAEKLDEINKGRTPSDSAPGTQMFKMLKYFKFYL